MSGQAYIDQPYEVAIETFAFCNAACTFCPYPTLDRQKTKMSDELIIKLIDEMAEWKLPFLVSPFKVNEPLLDPRFNDICWDITHNTIGTLRVFTNGQALTKRHIKEIGELPRVAHLWISLNDYRAEEYKQLMNLDFNKTVRNLDRLHDTDFPHQVVVSAVGHPNQAFRDYCDDRWPKFTCVVIKNGGWLGYTEAGDTEIPDAGCSRWFELSIMANGIVSLCCMDGEGKFPLGDVNKETMVEVYDRYRDRRAEGVSRLGIHPCNTCTI